MSNATLILLSGLGMMAVAVASVILWRRRTALAFQWFWIGAALWAAAVALKIVFALLLNPVVIGFLKHALPHTLMVISGSLYLGLMSSVFEVGLTLAAVYFWRHLGRDAPRAIGIGIGAGAVEALLLGMGSSIAALLSMTALPGVESARVAIEQASVTPLFWLVGPVERAIAIPVHAASRALVLLGLPRRRPLMIAGGFLIFTLLDSIAGGAHLAGLVGRISMWWIELAILPFALASLPILRACMTRWRGEPPAAPSASADTAA